MPMSLREKLMAVDQTNKRDPVPDGGARPAPQGCYDGETGFPFSLSRDFQYVSPETIRLFADAPLPSPFDPARILYLDTETTGLSHGAGTVAFLVGAGYLTTGGFVVRQLMMRDYPEERRVLRALQELLSGYDLIVTFNGRSFDLPLLQSRFLMNRMSAKCLELPHIDLLPIARRIWKLRLKSCSLSRLEEEIFHQPRESDLPGALVPQRYFEYLKTGDFSLLGDVLRHNAQDIASLFRLMNRIAQAYQAPEQQSFLEDVYSMGVALEKRGERDQARKCYRLALGGSLCAQSRLRLAHSYRREKDVSSAMNMFQEMAARGEGGAVPYIEMAKLYEHQLRDDNAALECTRKAIFLLSEPRLKRNEAVQSAQNALQYRYMRLTRRITRRAQA